MKPNKLDWIQRAIGGVSILHGKQADWLKGMTKDDIFKWAENEYNRHFEKEGK